MKKVKCDVAVIGGGPAGVAAAARAGEEGLETVLLENRDLLGGVPLQCVHTGFGVHYFGKDLTGPEFIGLLIDRLERAGASVVLGAHVRSISVEAYDRKLVRAVTPRGVLEVEAKAIVYAAGARERTIFEIGVVGDRPDGVYTAGEVQTLMDLYGVLPGKEAVIIGSGDVGLIVARRLALEGAKVKAVVELKPYPGGLTRNVVQCLEDFGIPLLLSHVVTRIVGRKRVEKVVVAKVDEKLAPVEGSEFEIACDMVIVAAGLVPNVRLLERMGARIDPSTGGPFVNEYLETSVPGVFAAGNALVINDLADHAAEQGELAAESAKLFVEEGLPPTEWLPVVKGRNVRCVVPHYISGERGTALYVRVKEPERNVEVRVPEAGVAVRLPIVRPAEMVKLKLPREAARRVKAKGMARVEVVPRG